MFKDIPEMTLDDIFRFLSKCSEPDENGCIVWCGIKDQRGYGTWRGLKCHRISYFLSTGSLNRNLLIRHLCENKSCINPKHLEIGNAIDNARDKMLSGSHKNQLLTFEDAIAIRNKFVEGRDRKSLSQDYNTSVTIITNIVANKTYHDPNYHYTPEKQKYTGSIFKKGNSFVCQFRGCYIGSFKTIEEAQYAIENLRKKIVVEERNTLGMSEQHISTFWSRVDKTDSCWLWRGYKDKDGYGVFGLNIDGKVKNLKVHRISYFLKNNSLDEGLLVRHLCNNRNCVNPEHLIQGTYKENGRDTVISGNCYNQKLSFDTANEIRKDYSYGISYKQLSKKYNISYSTVNNVVQNYSFKDENYKVPTKRRKMRSGSIQPIINSSKVQVNLGGKYLGSYNSYQEAQDFLDGFLNGNLTYSSNKRKFGSGSIYFQKERQKYVARTKGVNGKFVGRFDTYEEAEQALSSEDFLV